MLQLPAASFTEQHTNNIDTKISMKIHTCLLNYQIYTMRIYTATIKKRA